MAGDLTKYQRHYGALIADVDIGVLDTLKSSVLTARNSSYQIYVQTAYLIPAAYPAAAVTLKFQSSGSGTVIAIWNIPSSESTLAAEEPFVFSPGPQGTPLAIGDNLNLVLSAAGVVGRVHIEGYQRLAKTIGMNDGPAAQ